MATAMATTTVMTWEMVMTMRLDGNKEGKGKGNKGHGKGDEGGR